MAYALITCAAALVLGGCGGPPYMPARPAPSLLQASDASEHTVGFFEGVGKTRLFEQHWRPKTSPRAVVVVVHGLKDHSSRYADLARRLVQEGYAVHAFDLRGHAHSEGVRVGIDSFDDYLWDLDIFMPRVRTLDPGKPIFVLGHSMGGAIATEYALTRKTPLRGLALSGAALKIDVSGIKILGTKMVAALSPNAGVFNLDLDEFSRDPEVIRDGKSDAFVYQEGAPARTARELIGAVNWVDDNMESLTTPVLIMHGAADKVTPPEGSQDLYKRAGSTDKTLKLYPGLYHDLLHEPEKAMVTGDIVSWLNARAPESSPAGAR